MNNGRYPRFFIQRHFVTVAKGRNSVLLNFYSILEYKKRVKETYLHQVSFPDPK